MLQMASSGASRCMVVKTIGYRLLATISRQGNQQFGRGDLESALREGVSMHLSVSAPIVLHAGEWRPRHPLFPSDREKEHISRKKLAQVASCKLLRRLLH